MLKTFAVPGGQPAQHDAGCAIDPIVLSRLLSASDDGAEDSLLLRSLEALRKLQHAAAARAWLWNPEDGRLLAAESGVAIPDPEPIRITPEATAAQAAIQAPVIVNRQEFESQELHDWAQQHRIGAAAVLPLALCGRQVGQIELFVPAAGGPGVCQSVEDWRHWLTLIAAHAMNRRRSAASRNLAQVLLRVSPAAVVMTDARGLVNLWNPAAERMFGWKAAEAIGHALRIVPAERRSEAQQLQQHLMCGKSVDRLQTVRQRHDGTLIPVHFTAVPHYDAHGDVVGTLQMLSDASGDRRVTRREHLDRRIQQILELSDSTEQAGPPVLQVLCEAFDWSRGEFWSVDAGQESLLLEAQWSRSVESDSGPRSRHRTVARGEGIVGLAWEQAQFVVSPDGGGHPNSSRRPVACRIGEIGLAIPVIYRRQVLGVLAFHDVMLEEPTSDERQALETVAAQIGQFLHLQRTEATLQQTQSSLRQAQKMDAVGMLAGGIAHDFNNVLTVILSYSEIAAEEVDPDHPAHDMLKEIYNAGRRAASMTRRLLTFSRQHQEQLVPLNLNMMVTDMERMLRRLIGPNIALETNLEPVLGDIRGDASQIDQLLVNFVVNARDAIGEQGGITISTRHASLSVADAHDRPGARAGEFVVLSVRDTGCGMDEATKQRIFEPFFTTKEVGRGTGMGLATVAGIVRQSGGFVEVNSAPGQGTEMVVYLPRIPSRLATATFDARPEPIPRGHELVLIVEDDEILRTLIRRVIQARGYQVLEASDATGALAAIRKARRDVSLVLANVSLRGEPGDRLASRIRAVAPNTRVILIMDSGEETDQFTTNDHPEALHKPFTSDALSRKIWTVREA